MPERTTNGRRRNGAFGWSSAVAALALAGMPAGAEEIELATGDRLVASIVEQDELSVVAEHPLLGRLVLSRGAIVAIDGVPLHARPEEDAPGDPGGDEDGAKRGPAAIDPPPAEARPVSGTTGTAVTPPIPRPTLPEPPKSPWTTRIELGVSGAAGNTEEARGRVALVTTRTGELNLFRADSSFRYGTTRGDATENAFTAGVFSEWKKPEVRWSTFLQGRFDLDEFQAWDERVTANGGFSLRLVDVDRPNKDGETRDIFTLKGRVGAGVRKNFGGGDAVDNDLVPEGLFALLVDWRINAHMTVDVESTYYPDLAGFDEFRAVTAANWTVHLDDFKGIDFQLGLRHEYQSDVGPDGERNDVYGFAGIGLAF